MQGISPRTEVNADDPKDADSADDGDDNGYTHQGGDADNAGGPPRDGADARTALWYALLFSVPVGVGVSVAVMRMTGGGFTTPVVGLPGLATAAAIFAFVFLVARGGSPER